MTRFGATTLEELLDELAAPAPGPAGASAAALAAAMAASLVEMVARGTPAWSDGAAVAGRAADLRRRLVELAEEDAGAVARLLELFREPASADRAERVGLGLVAASRPPLEIAVAAAEVAELAVAASVEGKPVMRADASAAALLARGATRSATTVVETNLAAVQGDGAVAERAELSRLAGDALERVTGP